MSWNPFDLNGPSFLTLYLFLLIAAVPLSLWLPLRQRPAGKVDDGLSPDALAYLAGGRPRYIESVIATLLADGKLVLTKSGFSRTPGAEAAGQAEARVLASSDLLAWRQIERRLDYPARAMEDRLIVADLLMADPIFRHLRFLQTLPYLLLIAFGSIKWLVGWSRDRPVGFLTLLLIATIVIAVFRWASADRRTRGGIETLKRARQRFGRLARAPTRAEAGLAVAMFGTGVLAGSDLAPFHTLRSSSGDGGNGGGCGSGGSGGGGGCGGCGGS